MVEAVPKNKIHLYGIADIGNTELNIGESAPISGMIEKPPKEEAPSNLAVVGRYVLPPQIMSILKEVKPGAGGEIQLTDAIDILLKEHDVNAYRMQSRTHDCGNKAGYVLSLIHI